MSYQFSSELKSGYIHCRVSGDNTRENVARYLEDVHVACLEHQCSHVLIEENLKGPGFTVTEIYRVASQGSMKAWPHVKRVAYVDTNPEHSGENMQFAETVARNRGLFVQYFHTLEEAEVWLREVTA